MSSALWAQKPPYLHQIVKMAQREEDQVVSVSGLYPKLPWTNEWTIWLPSPEASSPILFNRKHSALSMHTPLFPCLLVKKFQAFCDPQIRSTVDKETDCLLTLSFSANIAKKIKAYENMPFLV